VRDTAAAKKTTPTTNARALIATRLNTSDSNATVGEEARLQVFHGNDIVLPAYGAAAAAIVPGELDRAGGVVRAQGEVEAIRAGHAGGTRWRTTK
jgi:hypothetical protein